MLNKIQTIARISPTVAKIEKMVVTAVCIVDSFIITTPS